jgi:NAD(P)-dependent dehydrogenase (short-subunit alcohol dehydrogenase family)
VKEPSLLFYANNPEYSVQLQILEADISSEDSIKTAIETAAASRFGPVNILIANAGITDELNHIPIWELPLEHWDRINNVNYRGTFLTIKHFLAAAKRAQDSIGHGYQLDNLAIVVTGSECGKFGQEGHVDYATGKAGLQYGLVRTVKNEIIRLNSLARINAVAPGWVNTPLIDGRLDDKFEAWAEAYST